MPINPLDALKSAYSWATTPVVPDSEGWRGAMDSIAQPGADTSMPMAMLRGFGAGALEGIRGLTTPLNLASAALPMLRAGQAAEAVPEAAQAVRGLSSYGKAMGTSAQGAGDIFNPGTAEVMEGMHQAAKPTFQAMQEAGAFGGDRSVEGVGGLLKPRASMPAEFSTAPAPDVEAAPSWLGKGAKAGIVPPKGVGGGNPVEQAYQRLLQQGGR